MVSDDVVIDSKYIQTKFINHLRRQKFDFAFENKFLFEKESDIIAVKGDFIYEYEVKIGLSDFEKDIRKCRHIESKPNFFFYIITDISFLNARHLDYAGVYLHQLSSDGFSYFKPIRPPLLIRDHIVTHFELYQLLRKVFNNKKNKG